MANWTAKLKGGDLTVTTEDVHAFRDLFIHDHELAARMADAFLFDLYVMDQEFGISPSEILASIKEVETGETPTGVKPATPFNRPPLKGLWHKHFFSARFVAHNILGALGKNGLEKLINEVMDPARSPVVTPEMIGELAHRVTNEPFESRDAAGKLTGEWIVYLPRGGTNYYLSISRHADGDQAIYDRIVRLAALTFPDIPKWIAEAASGSNSGS